MIRVAMFEPVPELREIFAFVLKFGNSCDVVLQSGDWQLVEDTLPRIDVLYAHLMPKVLDLEQIMKLRVIYPELGIVLYSDYHTSEEIIEIGADIHLSTPIHPMIITKAVQLAYENHH